jgi:hypothetical protein
MKKLLTVIAAVLALNFLGLAGGVGYLWKTGHLDRDRIKAIKDVLFPAAPAVTLAGAGSEAPATQPSELLDEMLKKAAGRTAEEQVAFIQQSFDSRMAQLDLRQRQIADQQHNLDFGRQRLAEDRSALEAEKLKVAAAEQKAALEANDQGFQDSLQLYINMPAKQVKSIFMTLSEETMMRYLEAMDAKTASKIIKEFKTPDEADRIQKVLERMRLNNADTAATQPTAEASPAAP